MSIKPVFKKCSKKNLPIFVWPTSQTCLFGDDIFRAFLSMFDQTCLTFNRFDISLWLGEHFDFSLRGRAPYIIFALGQETESNQMIDCKKKYFKLRNAYVISLI